MKNSHICIILIGILLTCNSAAHSYEPANISVNKKKHTVTYMIANQDQVLKDNLVSFVMSNGGKKNKEFAGLFKNGRLALGNDIKKYYRKKSSSLQIDLERNRLIFSGRIKIGKNSNHSSTSVYNFNAEKIIIKLDSYYGIIGKELDAYPGFRSLLLEAIKRYPLNTFAKKSSVDIKEGKIISTIYLKKDLPKISGKKIILPGQIKTAFNFKKAKKGIPSMDITALKTSVEKFLLSIKMPIVNKKSRAEYIVEVKIYPAIDQKRLLSRISGMKAIRSFRYKTAFKILKNRKTIAGGNCSVPGVHISKEQARMISAEKTGRSSARKIISEIIENRFNDILKNK